MIIIDVEIKKAILGRNETPIEGIEYCGGWRDFAGMGIACVCTYDITTHLSRVFLEEDLPALFEYLRNKPTAGFNTKRFDIPLLAEHWISSGLMKDKDSIGCPHYDMLEQIWLALGLDPDKFNPRTHGGWGLDAVCQATLGIAKTGHGALAPVWWQQGKRGKVIDYCLNDVWMEGQLLLHIVQHGWVTRDQDKLARNCLPVRPPEGVRYGYKAAPITGPAPNPMGAANADNPLNAKLYSELFTPKALEGSADASGEAGPHVTSPGGLGIIR